MKEHPAPAAQAGKETDERLLRMFLDGDERSFEELMRRYRDRVFRMALRLTGGDEAAAGDITQHTFVKLFTSGGTFRGEGSLASWIYATASNAAMSERRRNVRLVRNPVETSETPDPGADIDMQSERHRLDGAVARLPEKQRLVLSMRVDTEMPFEQIARAAGMSVNSAKVNYHHAVTALKRLLAAEDGK